jgi:hypothetical protein
MSFDRNLFHNFSSLKRIEKIGDVITDFSGIDICATRSRL